MKTGYRWDFTFLLPPNCELRRRFIPGTESAEEKNLVFSQLNRISQNTKLRLLVVNNEVDRAVQKPKLFVS